MKKVNLTKVHISKFFYGYIYPVFAEKFLFGDNYEKFVEIVSEKFILTSNQWEQLLEEWEFKEKLLGE